MVETDEDRQILDDPAGTDSTALLRREALLQSGVFQNAILASSEIAVIATDASGLIQLFNAGAERMLGFSAVEVINRCTAVDLHDPGELLDRARAVSWELATTIAPQFETLTCKAALGIEDRYEATLIHKDGERIPVAIAISVVPDGNGGILGYSLLVTDISVRKQLPSEPSEAPSAAQPPEPSKPDLLTRMSHEMRTPLSAILGFAQLMETGLPAPSDAQRKNIARILEAGWQLEKLIKMTRDLALIESGILSLSPEPVSLAEVMLECEAIIEAQAQIRGVRVTFPVFETPCAVSADRNWLQEVLAHLLSAAIECSELYGPIVVDCNPHGAEWIRIDIHHGGAGTSVQRLTRTFQASDELEQEAGTADGTSIGLLLARRLVELMGGAIAVVRNDRKRQAFSFDLKRVLVPMGPVQNPALAAFNAAETAAANHIKG